MINFSAEANKQAHLLRHRFGVNYVPSENWYFCYNAWNPDSIARDLDGIAALGADHLRLMLIWPWFQPNPTYVSQRHLDYLEQTLALAAERQLDVLVTLYTGWLSGYHFNLPYLEDEPFYTSPRWEPVQTLFLEAVAQRMQAHVNFMGFDLGNEINCNWQASTIDGDAWMQRRLAQMRAVCPGRVHVNGVDHQPWFSPNTFSPQALIAQQEIVTLHCWPFWSGARQYGGPLETPYTHLAGGMATLARAYGNAPQKPIWVEEFGACSEEMPAQDVPGWLEKTLTAALEQGVSWFTWWGSHDIDQRLQFHPFEYSLGLLTQKNQIKPQGQVFKRFAEAFRAQPVAIPSTPLPPPPTGNTEQTTWGWLLKWMGWMK